MLLAVDAADRLADLVAERGSVSVEEAGRQLLALERAPAGLAMRVLERLAADDARFLLADGSVRLAPAPSAAVTIDRADFAVLDLETTGLGAGAAITEAAAVVVTRGRATRELFVEIRRPERQHAAVARLLRFAGDAVLCGHNLRFDVGFLDRQLRARGLRIAAPTVDTLSLARRLLAGRTRAFSLAALAEFFGCASTPSHRALPDARATAEVLVRLLELAAEAGATTVGDVAALARPRASR